MEDNTRNPNHTSSQKVQQLRHTANSYWSAPPMPLSAFCIAACLSFEIRLHLGPQYLCETSGGWGHRVGVCAPLRCKNLCWASRSCTWGGGAVGSRSKQMSKGLRSKMLGQWHNLRALESKMQLEGGAPVPLGTRKTRTVSTSWINPGALALIGMRRHGWSPRSQGARRSGNHNESLESSESLQANGLFSINSNGGVPGRGFSQ